ncbi:thioredoxin [Deminuibacter soli]|uniref:Thioredoxin n=1 Tax=Deminuibacter soli TaxID=2291815 RepID=A0A3E1NMS7_9BACT|nr:thioredoxin [Deminuibacter soli]
MVLVNFCTFSCINWLRQLPYVRAWAQKYKDQGLVVLGVQTPEFPFEENADNVRHAFAEMNIQYPVAIDNNHEIWRVFKNEYWPALYFVDAKGNIRHHHFGEGDYEQSEKVIQQLLAEAGNTGVSQDLVAEDAQGIELAADWSNLQSQENYVNAIRTQGFASRGGVRPLQPLSYTAPARLELNQWALAGEWTMGLQSTVLNKANGRMIYRFHARDLNLVMGALTPGTAIKFRVRIDGLPPVEAHGIDTDSDGFGTVKEQRLYQLIRQQGPVTDRLFEIEFLTAGVETFSFTFG